MKRLLSRRITALAVVGALLAVAAQPAAAIGSRYNKKPSFVKGEVIKRTYDGVSNDLLTGGLGKSGLAESIPPAFVDPENPTEEELRTRAIHGNYRALIDTVDGGGYGVFFGPNVTADGTVTDSEGLIAGDEVIAFADNGSGRLKVTMMVQIPSTFDPEQACIVTGPSSGSRGVYGAIGTSGEWGLKNGCAVAYTDKGTGTGAHNLATNTVGLIDGIREDANTAGKASTFTAMVSIAAREEFDATFPNRWAFKHAHSQLNPEKDWDKNVLQVIEFAFWVLNEKLGIPGRHGKVNKVLFPSNTIVIASSVSNGGGASVRAAELDRHGLIDGVAVSEPNVNPKFDPRFSIVQGDDEPLFAHSRSLYDYTTVLNVYQGCASADPVAIADDLGPPPLNFAPSPVACQSLHDLGLLTADDLIGQAAEAQAIINDFGILEEQNVLMPSHWFINVPQGVAVTYANAYSRASVLANLCGYSFGATDGDANPMALSSESEAALFGTSNGIPPTAGVNLINNDGLDGPKEYRASTPDQNLAGALCLRALATGRDPASGKRLRGRELMRQILLKFGIHRIRATGNLRGKPAIFVTGRADAILPPNHTSRAYFGLNQMKERDNSGLRYVEVLNAQHLDALNGLPGFKERYIPLHHYFNQALDLMLDYLRNGTPLPPSQVVRTTRRGVLSDSSVPDLAESNIPEIPSSPDAGDLITFEDGQVRIPE